MIQYQPEVYGNRIYDDVDRKPNTHPQIIFDNILFIFNIALKQAIFGLFDALCNV